MLTAFVQMLEIELLLVVRRNLEFESRKRSQSLSDVADVSALGHARHTLRTAHDRLISPFLVLETYALHLDGLGNKAPIKVARDVLVFGNPAVHRIELWVIEIRGKSVPE